MKGDQYHQEETRIPICDLSNYKWIHIAKHNTWCWSHDTKWWVLTIGWGRTKRMNKLPQMRPIRAHTRNSSKRHASMQGDGEASTPEWPSYSAFGAKNTVHKPQVENTDEVMALGMTHTHDVCDVMLINSAEVSGRTRDTGRREILLCASQLPETKWAKGSLIQIMGQWHNSVWKWQCI